MHRPGIERSQEQEVDEAIKSTEARKATNKRKLEAKWKKKDEEKKHKDEGRGDKEMERKIKSAYEAVKGQQQRLVQNAAEERKTEDDEMWAAHEWKGSKGSDRLEALLERCEENRPGSNETIDEMMRMLEQNHIEQGRNIHTPVAFVRDLRAKTKTAAARQSEVEASAQKAAPPPVQHCDYLIMPIADKDLTFFLLGGVAQPRRKGRHDLAVRHT